MKSFLTILIIASFIISGCEQSDQVKSVFFLSNLSQGKFDSALFVVEINHEEVFADTVENQYLSFAWQERSILIPKDSLRLRVKVIGNGFKVEKDTFVLPEDSVFVRFNFLPYSKRYNNPDIYKFIEGTTSRFTEIADSLYANGIIKNTESYLNDSLPEKQSIEISLK